MTRPDVFERAVQSVVTADNCSGCGACALINPNYTMRLSSEGFNRPVKTGSTPITATDLAARTGDFEASCPGVRVNAPNALGSRRDGYLGPVVSSWQAWATDADTRFRGSSGGTLTALTTWLLQTGRAARVVGARSAPASPARTESVVITRSIRVRDTAGSRYGPVSTAAEPTALDPDTAFVGKPCEVSALRQLSAQRQLNSQHQLNAHSHGHSHGPETRPAEPPILLSFFCAGVPSQRATDTLIEALGIARGTPLNTMRYRGHGWPGDFVAETGTGTRVATTYDESWGKTLGPSVQWRCKICPDGMGESADIVAGDFWRTDARGYPVFDDGAGISALIARTPRGHTLLMAAIAAGVIHAEPLDVARIAAIQPLQIARRRTLLGRLAGRALAGWRVPRYTGFGLLARAAGAPVASLRFAYGSFRRSLTRSRLSRPRIAGRQKRRAATILTPSTHEEAPMKKQP